jgi:sugar lactone lactonase YvrE
MFTPVTVATHPNDQLGEGSLWDPERGRLLWVDIPAGLVHEWDPVTGSQGERLLGGEVSAVSLRAAGGLVVAAGKSIRLLEDDAVRVLIEIEADLPGNRTNDCRCDPEGRLWIGTMARSLERGAGSLYRLDPDLRLLPVLERTTLANGIGWSPDGALMYFIDTTTQRIDVFDFDRGTGAVAGRRSLTSIDPEAGMPDGLCVDIEGGVWVALWGGGAIHRYDDGGTLDAVIPLPVSNPTCPAFGGADLETLYITSARDSLSAAELAEQPAAGAVLALDPGVRGLPATPFAG